MKKLLIIPILFCSFWANAQIDFADTAIESPNIDVSVANRLTLTAKIVSKHEGNNASHRVQIVILLPEARVYSFSARTETGAALSCAIKKHPASSPTHDGGYIICQGGSIQRNTSTTPNRYVKIKVVTGVPNFGPLYPANFAIMTYNLVPDSDMKNNFWTWK